MMKKLRKTLEAPQRRDPMHNPMWNRMTDDEIIRNPWVSLQVGL